LSEKWRILQEDPDVSNLFETKPLLSFRRERSIGDRVVRSSSQTEQIAGTFPCGRSRCLTCDHVTNELLINGVKGSFRIKESYTCITPNIVYCLTCTACDSLYIGETKRRLGDRVREHLRDIRTKNSNSPVALHFNKARHSIEYLAVSVLARCSADQARKQLEMRLIHKRGTLDPLGMIVDFTMNVESNSV
jgi:hypothetical protein